MNQIEGSVDITLSTFNVANTSSGLSGGDWQQTP